MGRLGSGFLFWKTAGAILVVCASCSLIEDFDGLTPADGVGGSTGSGSTANTTISTGVGQTGTGGMTATSSGMSTGSGTAGEGVGGKPGAGGGSSSTIASTGAGGMMPAKTSVQSGAAAIPAGGGSGMTTITAVDPTKSVLFFSVSFDDAAGSPGNSQVTGTLTNATTLTFARANAGGPLINIAWSVVQFASGVTVQRGVLNAPATNVADVAIASVNLAHAFPIISKSVTGNVYDNNDFNRAELTSPTTLELTLDGGGVMAGGTVAWQVVEYEAANVQSGNVAFNDATDTTLTATLGSSITPGKSLLIFSHGMAATGASSPPYRSGFTGSITNATTLTFGRNAVEAAGKDNLTYYLVEFADATTVQSGTSTFTTADLSHTATLTTVDPKRAVPVVLGQYGRSSSSDFAASANMGVNSFAVSLSDPSTVSIVRSVTGSSNAVMNWSVVEFQ